MAKRVSPIKRISKATAKALKRHHFIFKTISNVGHKRRDIILKNAPLSLFKAIKILFSYLVKGQIPLKTRHRRQLVPHRQLLIEGASSTPQTIKRKATQSGAGLGSILRTVIPILGPIIASIL